MKKSFIFGLARCIAPMLLAGLFMTACQGDGKGNEDMSAFRSNTGKGWDELLEEYIEKYGDFVDDTVCIILTQEASKMYLYTDEVYTIKDFHGIDVLEVIHGNPGVTANYRAQIEAERNGNLQSYLEERLKYGIQPRIIENYRAMIELKLREKSKINVIKAIELLGAREDIEYAGASLYHYLDTDPVDDY